jgi:excinuclease ABC subunit A
MESTVLVGARTHNLRSVDLTLRPGEFIVVAGVSGSGKSSLALDTLYAEGQRRFVESFSAYARQFLERRDRPPVSKLDPVPAAIAVDRGAPVRTSRSTVGTMTELQDYLRLLWSRAATITCDSCGREVSRGTVSGAARAVIDRAGENRVRSIVTYSVSADDPERWLGVRESLAEQGYRRLLIDGRAVDIDEVAPRVAVSRGEVEVIVDRLVVEPKSRSRVAEAIGTAMLKGPCVRVHMEDGAAPARFARGLECAHCQKAYAEPSSALFNFQSPIGACGACKGFGRTIELDYEKVVSDDRLSIDAGAIKPWTGPKAAWERAELAKFCKANKIDTTAPWRSLSAKDRKRVLEGEGDWIGVKGWFDWLETKTYKMHVRVFLSRFRKYETCRACQGSRLKPEVERYRVAALSLTEAGRTPVSALRERLATLPSIDEPTDRLVGEVLHRLEYLSQVGLGYLTLDRPSRTLSGGEVQRVALTAALGTSLTGTLMVLDEPTVGLHPRDAERLVDVARGLARLGNVAVVVEHDLSVIASADRVIELGPGAGENGGRIVFDGAPEALRSMHTPTGLALRGSGRPTRKRRVADAWLVLEGARGNNLKGQPARFPLGLFTCVTGVSGSGKSTLVSETLVPAASRMLGAPCDSAPLPYTGLVGIEKLSWITFVDQSPLGRTSRGNAATYTGAWDAVRAAFAALPEAKERGYATGTFSFNVDGGRCPSCQGEGFETVEMQFLADVSFTCPDCKGKRFRDEVLELRLHGHTVADVLAMSAQRAVEAFPAMKPLVRALTPLIEVGLGYLPLGQPLSMLSGGEAQRLKLARALSEAGPGTLVVMDEPTAGLHRADVDHVLRAIEALIARDATVIAVEHDPYVVAQADWVMDLGPEASDQGGTIVCEGAPELVAQSTISRFAPFLREALEGGPTQSIASAMKSARDEDLATRTSVVVEGAREHNLRVGRLEIPREKLVAFTGPSGSGKSSMAFDVVYAEGQRRFLETLSPYARQYLPSLGRADVDRIAGIPPAISLEQRTARAGAMSTVATVTEVAHYLRLLFAKVATPHCPVCNLAITARSADVIADDLRQSLGAKGKARVWAPVVRARKGLHKEAIERAMSAGVERVRVDGVEYATAKVPALAKSKVHDVLFDLGEAPVTDREAMVALVQRSAALAHGHAVIETFGAKATTLTLSTRSACPKCGRGVPELDPRHFSFNTAQGRCPKCEGAGVDDEGRKCKACDGTRLAPIPRAVRLGKWRYNEVVGMCPSELRAAVKQLELDARQQSIGRAPITELESRLRTLEELGLDYLALDRRANTLSGGEMQRLRLAAQIGAGLTGVLYVLDEPTIGLHASDTHRLVTAMRRLVSKGASVFVVEHDASVIRSADWVVDMGPTGGKGGGRVVAEGPASEVLASEQSPTAQALKVVPGASAKGRPVDAKTPKLTVHGASAHNLDVVRVDFPLQRLVAVAGVSGSGKSTLVDGVLFPAVCAELGLECEEPLAFDKIAGCSALRAAKRIDQSPIGRTPRSVPATYVGLWDDIRKLLAATPEARARGWTASRFSFNTSAEKGGGRCEACEGAGVKHVEMSFLPDVVVPCEVCEGLRFSRETREVKLHGYDAGSLLALTVDEAKAVFSQVGSLSRPLEVLSSLGLGYLTLGQGSHTLSGGEAQRVKLATELSGRGGGTLYVLDEPTTGLHVSDVERLVTVLQKLVDRGDSVIVVEHHPNVLAAADWVVELGPGGGKHGGKLVAANTPSLIAKGSTATGKVLREEMAQFERSTS